MKNLKIKTKLMLLSLIPSIMMILMGGKVIYNEYQLVNSNKEIQKLISLSVVISKLVHETQKERGMCAGYLGNNGKKFDNLLASKRDLVNIALSIKNT